MSQRLLEVDETMFSLYESAHGVWGQIPQALEKALRRPWEGVPKAPQGKRNHAFHDTNLHMGVWGQVTQAQQWGDSHRLQSRLP